MMRLPSNAISRAALASHTMIILLAFAAPLVMSVGRRPLTGAPRAFVWTAVAFVLVVLGCYIRFLLPALALMLILVSFTMVRLADLAPVRSIALVPLVTGLAASYVFYARTHEAFALATIEHRSIAAGTYVGRSLPSNAVVVTIQQFATTASVPPRCGTRLILTAWTKRWTFFEPPGCDRISSSRRERSGHFANDFAGSDSVRSTGSRQQRFVARSGVAL